MSDGLTHIIEAAKLAEEINAKRDYTADLTLTGQGVQFWLSWDGGETCKSLVVKRLIQWIDVRMIKVNEVSNKIMEAVAEMDNARADQLEALDPEPEPEPEPELTEETEKEPEPAEA